MTRCAMCENPATRAHNIKDQGILEVCEGCKNHLVHVDKMKEEFKDSLKRIINTLNEHYTKVPLAQAPTRKFENNGIRSGLKIAIGEIEKKLAELIK